MPSRNRDNFPLMTDTPVSSGSRPAGNLVYALLTALTVFVALVLFAVYVLSRKPKFAPPLVFKDHAGIEKPLSGELHQGKPILLHFWATWCAPCREELPALTRAAHEAGDSIIFLPVAVDEGKPEAVDNYLNEQKLSLPTLYDPGAGEAQKIGTQSFPETWLLTPDGKVVAHWEGAVEWNGAMLSDRARRAATM